MSSNIVAFPGLSPTRGRTGSVFSEPDDEAPGRTRRRNGRNMHTFVFRSYDLIVESDEADLIHDVGIDMHKAEVKLKKIRERLQSVREQSAGQIQLLTDAETKLTAAIVAALLSAREGKSDGS